MRHDLLLLRQASGRHNGMGGELSIPLRMLPAAASDKAHDRMGRNEPNTGGLTPPH
jgi:hypothetical protein